MWLVGLIVTILSSIVSFADIPQRCIDTNGKSVPVIAASRNFYRGWAEAMLDSNGRPFIIYNPSRIADFSELFRLFTFYHECAHIVLGHVYHGRSSIEYENDADCWSIGHLSSHGFIQDQELNLIQQEFRNLGWDDDATHPSGTRRAANIGKCMAPVDRLLTN